jgi:DNA processing protein
MNKINKIAPDTDEYLQMMRGIANLPKSLYLLGNIPKTHAPTVAVIGTRKPSAYGQEVGYRLAYDLAKRGVVVLSGLALGLDAIAHKAALDAGGKTIAVMPGGLDSVHPRQHTELARRILLQGGALVSEYAPGTTIYPSNFVARNRIVAAIADGVLVVEAALKSGTVHTAGFALDYGRPVMAVPGNITNPMSTGTNRLIATGACMVTSVADILDEIGVKAVRQKQMALPLGDTPHETTIINLIATGLRDGDDLQRHSSLPSQTFSQAMTMLEINGVIRPLGGNQWAFA